VDATVSATVSTVARIREVKPDVAIFRHVLDELGATAAQTTFLDDRLENVDAARALGIRATAFHQR